MSIQTVVEDCQYKLTSGEEAAEGIPHDIRRAARAREGEPAGQLAVQTLDFVRRFLSNPTCQPFQSIPAPSSRVFSPALRVAPTVTAPDRASVGAPGRQTSILRDLVQDRPVIALTR